MAFCASAAMLSPMRPLKLCLGFKNFYRNTTQPFDEAGINEPGITPVEKGALMQNA
jgi:hypothetical protein